MMILVAVGGLAAGGNVTWRRRAVFLAHVEHHELRECLERASQQYWLDRAAKEQREAKERSLWPDPPRTVRVPSPHTVMRFPETDCRALAAKAGALATAHAAMRRKYERAARYPWLSVAPDLPAPE
jgi:hypothetical protein